MTFPTIDETILIEECLEHLGKDKTIIPRTAYVLELVAHSSVGLGEVLQDYAHQAWDQLRHVVTAAQHKSKGMQSAEDKQTLETPK